MLPARLRLMPTRPGQGDDHKVLLHDNLAKSVSFYVTKSDYTQAVNKNVHNYERG